MQPLHEDDHHIARLVVEAGDQGRRIPFVDIVADGLGAGGPGLERIVDNNHVRAPSGQGAADGGRQAAPARGGHALDPGVFAKPRARKKGAVPAAVDDLPELPGQGDRQGVGIAHADEAQLGVAAQGPSDESDGCADRFQGAGRLRDDQAPALAIQATGPIDRRWLQCASCAGICPPARPSGTLSG